MSSSLFDNGRHRNFYYIVRPDCTLHISGGNQSYSRVWVLSRGYGVLWKRPVRCDLLPLSGNSSGEWYVLSDDLFWWLFLHSHTDRGHPILVPASGNEQRNTQRHYDGAQLSKYRPLLWGSRDVKYVHTQTSKQNNNHKHKYRILYRIIPVYNLTGNETNNTQNRSLFKTLIPKIE